MILEIITTITSRFQSSLRQGIKLNPLYTLTTMINIFHDKSLTKLVVQWWQWNLQRKCAANQSFWFIHFSLSTDTHTEAHDIARQNCCLSLLLVTWDILPGEMSAPQQQNLDNDDINQSLHINKSGSHGVPNVHLFSYMVLGLSANELQQNSNASSRKECIPQILTIL